MNAVLKARLAYNPAKSILQTPRTIESRVLSNITSRLIRHADEFPGLVQAIHDNRQFWTILASDVANPKNGLPRPLRAQIFYLAEFTEQHSQKYLRGDGDLLPLIEINKAIIRGLNGQGQD